MNRTNSVAALLALALLGTNLSMSPPIQDRGRVDTGFVLEAGDHNVLDLIDRAAEFLGRNILSEPATIMAASPGGAPVITIQNQIAVDALGCEDLLSQLLYTKGFALVPIDISKGLYEVIAMYGPRRALIQEQAITMTPDEVLRRPNLKMPVVTSLTLEHIQVQVATNSLRPFFATAGQSGSLTIGNVGSNQAMLLRGFADQVAAAIRLVRLADVSSGSVYRGVEERMRELEKRIAALEEKVGR